MPNTLAHLGAQGLLSRSLSRNVSIAWVFLGCLIPDLPWIAQRAVRALAPGAVSPYDLRLYAIAQSSLVVCLLACACFASLSAKPGRVFGVLSSNCLLHLLLDAVQSKWANGVHLAAPFSWKLTNVGLFWPESAPTVLLTLLGLAYASWALLRNDESREPWWLPRPLRWASAALFLLAYVLLPFALLDGPRRADNHFVATLQDVANRPGRYVEFDRPYFERQGERARVRTFAGEWLDLTSIEARTGTVSLRGRFVDSRSIAVEEFHQHWPLVRDSANYVGLTLVAALWLRGARRVARARASGGTR